MFALADRPAGDSLAAIPSRYHSDEPRHASRRRYETCGAPNGNIRVERVGGIWPGTIDGHPEIDERGLTEEIARRKVNDVASRLTSAPPPSKSPHEGGGISARLRRKRRMS